MRRRIPGPALGVLLVVCLARPVCADVATAEALFREGRRLLEEGHTAEACERLADSQRLDPSSGTLINLAACHAELGLTATAWAEFLGAARLANAQQRPRRAEEAMRRAAELEPKVPYLTVRVAALVPGLVVTRDGERLADSAIGLSLPVDPGTHVVRVAAPGHAEWSGTLEIKQPGEHRVVDVPELKTLSPPPARARPAPRPPSPPPLSSAPLSVPPPSRLAPPVQRALPLGFWVSGGVALGAAALGGVFGGLSLGSYGEAESLCRSRVDCTADAMQARRRAEQQANVANVALGTAVVAAGVAGWVYFTRKPSAPHGARAVRSGPAW